MGIEFVPLGALPNEFLEIVKSEFVPYSVALGRVIGNDASTFVPLGSGTLVKKCGRVGILTARHCLHACSPEIHVGPNGQDSLLLVLARGRNLMLPPNALLEHPLTKPKSEEYGPDLTFLEIIPGASLGWVSAFGSVWSLDRNHEQILQEFGIIGTGLASIGYPELDCSTTIDGNDIYRINKHMAFLNSIGAHDIHEKDGWDYIESKCDFSTSPNLPMSFAGVSGGPIWAMQIRKHEVDGHLSIERSALVGVTFYQTEFKDRVRYLRGHFVKSIYDLAWQGFCPSGFCGPFSSQGILDY